MIYALLQDAALLDLIKRDEDKAAFHALYKRYWKNIFLSAYKKTRSKEIAEELTQNLFLNLWERRHEIAIQNLQSWLFTAIKFSVINHYKSQIVHEKYLDYVKGNINEEIHTTEQLSLLADLSEAIDKGISLLPEKTQQVFKLSRIENRSVKEISKDLNISEKAVEYHITQSLKQMRIYLKDYLLLMCSCAYVLTFS